MVSNKLRHFSVRDFIVTPAEMMALIERANARSIPPGGASLIGRSVFYAVY